MIRRQFFISLAILILASFNVLAADIKPIRVLISQLAEHPALNSTRQGIIDALEEAGYKQGETLDLKVESAQANPILAQQIASKFENMESDVVVAIGTVSAQSLAKAAHQKKIKLVFSSVTDPQNAGLVKDLKHPNGNITGVSNFVPLEPQLKLFKKLLPTLKKIGFLYNAGEANSVSLANTLEKLCSRLGLILVKQTADKTAAMPQSAIKLASLSDAIFVSNDNTALAALPSIIRAADKTKTPVFLSDTEAVALGAVAALGPNQYEIGKQTGRMIVRILQGEAITTQPVEFPETTELYLNRAAAAKAGITIPTEVSKTAAKIIDSSE